MWSSQLDISPFTVRIRDSLNSEGAATTSSHSTTRSASAAARTVVVVLGGVIRRLFYATLIGSLILAGTYYCLLHSSGSTLVHLYEPLPPAGPLSVYVPGGGFSGFWWHLGALDALKESSVDPLQYEYYCYSSGCLSLFVALMQKANLETTIDTCFSIQSQWESGNISTYDMVDQFIKELIIINDSDENHNNYYHQQQQQQEEQQQRRMFELLNRVNILVTTPYGDHGALSAKATNMTELHSLLVKTTWIPMVTGNTIFQHDDGRYFVDGAFSRPLHPKCEFELVIPSTFQSFLHSLNPAMTKDVVYRFFRWGQQHNHPFVNKS